MQWISIKDRVPPVHVYVLCYIKKKYDYSFNSYGNIKIKWVPKNITQSVWFSEVTHWMPLPEPPEKEEALLDDNGLRLDGN